MAKTTTKKESKGKYYEAVGRRKTAVARVRLFEASKGDIVVNDKPLADYFPVDSLQEAAKAPLEEVEMLGNFKITVKVQGGGQSGQADAVSHGIARALLEFDADLRKKLKAAGHLKRDPRSKERKKFGLKKARKAAQWSKR